jgi:hypothetical protein
MHYRHNTNPRENGNPCCTKFETSQKNQPTTRRCGRPANSTNQKTIGINKLGTLLSSQTTNTWEYFSEPDPKFSFEILQSSLFLRRGVLLTYSISFPLVKSVLFGETGKVFDKRNQPQQNKASSGFSAQHTLD